MKRLRQQGHFLSFLVKLPTGQVKTVLKTATRDQVLALGEIFHNILNGNIKLTRHQIRDLSRYKNAVRNIGDSGRISWKRRRTYLQNNPSAVVRAIKIIKQTIEI